MIYVYIRISTDKQILENHKFEIENFCKNNNMQIDDRIEETITGKQSYNKCLSGKLLKKVGTGDYSIYSELS